MLNLLIVQWPLFRCCRVIVSYHMRSIARKLTIVHWAMSRIVTWFRPGHPTMALIHNHVSSSHLARLQLTLRLILFLIYFPAHLKYQRILPIEPSTGYGATTGRTAGNGVKEKVTTTPEWRLAITLGIVVALHL